MSRRRAPRPPLALLLLAGVLLLASPVGAAPDGSAPPSPRAIDEAIEKGVTWLLEEQGPKGSWGSGSRELGHTMLATYALLHAGVDPASDKAMKRAVRWIRKNGPGLRRTGDRDARTYSLSLLILLLRDLGAAGDRIRLERLVPLLQRMQAENGQWSYGWKPGRATSAGDNSNAQFAVLAMGAAAGAGLPVKAETLKRAWGWWATTAQRDGGFGYASGGSRASASTGSMTAAGVASLAILEAALAGRPTDTREAHEQGSRVLERAIARLAEDFRVDRNFGPAQGGVGQRQRNAGRGWVHYYLWSIERAMVLAGREKLAGRDWYAEGARHLLDTQKKDGSWRGEHPLYATSFALLFLTRAADPPRVFTPPATTPGPVTEPTKRPDPAEAPPPPPPLPESMGTWLAEDRAVNERVDAFRQWGASKLVLLVPALGHRDAKVRQRANELLRLLLGDETIGRADRHPLARGRLRLYLVKHARYLVWKDGRFVASNG